MKHKLSDSDVINAKPKDKPYNLTDGGGLYLKVTVAGKYWRYNYSFNGKQKTYAMGVYPDTSLKQARDTHDNARKLLAQGVDPSQQKQTVKSKRAKNHIENEDLLSSLGQLFEAVKIAKHNNNRIIFDDYLRGLVYRVKSTILDKMTEEQKDGFYKMRYLSRNAVINDRKDFLLKAVKEAMDLAHSSGYVDIARGLDGLFVLSDNSRIKPLSHDELMTYAVIGAMTVTGGDAEEAARLLGVTVDFVNERF